MPTIGLIRGIGEGEIATGHLIKLGKALNRRFRSGIKFEELAVGDCIKYGYELTCEAVESMRKYGCIFSGDMCSTANVLNYSTADIALSLSNDTEYTCVSGFGDYSNIDIHIVNYFDGNSKLRYSENSAAGVCETRVCSTYSAVNIVKAVIKGCEERRRRLTFVKDSENEYCSDLFFGKFEEFALPLSNFRLLGFSIDDITGEMYDNPSQFDTVFASKSFADFTGGLLRAKLGKKMSIYSKFLRSVPVYAVKAIESNSYTENYLPSLASYVTAFGDMLRDIFCMEKEATVLRNAVNEALNLKDYTNPEVFFKCIEENLNNPVTTKYPKRKKPH